MIKNLIIVLLLFSFSLTVSSQSDTLVSPQFSSEQRDSIYSEWIEDLYAFGVERTSDSIVLNKDLQRILADSSYRNLIYPEAYSMPVVQLLIHKGALKPAFWYLINIYASVPESREALLKIIIPLDQLIELDKAFVATYYTYIAFDPEVYTIVEGKELPREVSRPDIAEKKLLATKDIVEHVMYYRAKKSED